MIEQISIDELVVDNTQSRETGSWSGDEQDQRLTESVGNDGVLQPCLVRPVEMTSYGDSVDESYAVIAGSRRYNASVKAGLESVPCNVIEADDLEAASKSLKENQERKDLTKEEVAVSMLLQKEILGIDEDADMYHCSFCDYEDELDQSVYLHKIRLHDDFTPKQGVDRDNIDTPQGANRWLAQTHFPELSQERARDKVREHLEYADLPQKIRILLKDQKQRSAKEAETLSKFGISENRTISGGEGMDSNLRSVIRLYNDLADVDGLEAETRTLKAVGDLDVDDTQQTAADLGKSIETVREKFDKELDDDLSRKEKEREFTDVVSSERQRLLEISETLDSVSLTGVPFSLDEPSYNRYHARAKTQEKIKTDKEMVKTGYVQYLEQLSEENDW